MSAIAIPARTGLRVWTPSTRFSACAETVTPGSIAKSTLTTAPINRHNATTEARVRAFPKRPRPDACAHQGFQANSAKMT